jgi:hypothetical protein
LAAVSCCPAGSEDKSLLNLHYFILIFDKIHLLAISLPKREEIMATPTFAGYKNSAEATIAFWIWRLEQKGDLPKNEKVILTHRNPFQEQIKDELGLQTYGAKVNHFIELMYQHIADDLRKPAKTCSLETRHIKALTKEAGFDCTLPWEGSTTVSTAVDVKYRGPWEEIWKKR